MIPFVTQVLALLGGLLLSAVWPRDPRPLLDRDSVINLATGAMLFALRLLISLTGIYTLRVGLLSTSWLTSPPLQLLFAFVLLDLVRYWLHRMHHRVPFFWWFHRVHHSARTLDSTTGFRMHAVDFVQLSVVPVLLFGILLDTTAWPAWVLPVSLVPGIVADALEHSNSRFAPRPAWLRYVFNNPLFHSWHHVRHADLCDGNYANALPVWDLIFRSDVSQDVPPPEYGLVPKKDLRPDFLGLHLLRPPDPP